MDIYTLELFIFLVLLYSFILLGVVLEFIEDKRILKEDESHIINRPGLVKKEIWKSNRFKHKEESILTNL